MIDYLAELKNELPTFLTTRNLVELGMYASVKCVHAAMTKGKAPLSIRIGRKILFPRAHVIEFFQVRSACAGDAPKTKHK